MVLAFKLLLIFYWFLIVLVSCLYLEIVLVSTCQHMSMYVHKHTLTCADINVCLWTCIYCNELACHSPHLIVMVLILCMVIVQRFSTLKGHNTSLILISYSWLLYGFKIFPIFNIFHCLQTLLHYYFLFGFLYIVTISSLFNMSAVYIWRYIHIYYSELEQRAFPSTHTIELLLSLSFP